MKDEISLFKVDIIRTIFYSCLFHNLWSYVKVLFVWLSCTIIFLVVLISIEGFQLGKCVFLRSTKFLICIGSFLLSLLNLFFFCMWSVSFILELILKCQLVLLIYRCFQHLCELDNVRVKRAHDGVTQC